MFGAMPVNSRGLVVMSSAAVLYTVDVGSADSFDVPVAVS
jgi:hypothetical protein